MSAKETSLLEALNEHGDRMRECEGHRAMLENLKVDDLQMMQHVAMAVVKASEGEDVDHEMQVLVQIIVLSAMILSGLAIEMCLAESPALADLIDGSGGNNGRERSGPRG